MKINLKNRHQNLFLVKEKNGGGIRKECFQNFLKCGEGKSDFFEGNSFPRIFEFFRYKK